MLPFCLWEGEGGTSYCCQYLVIGRVSSGYGVHKSIFNSLMNNNANHVVTKCEFSHFFPIQIFSASYTPVM